MCRNREKMKIIWDQLIMFRGEEKVVKDVDLQGVKSGVREISNGDEGVKDEVEIEEVKSGDRKEKAKKTKKKDQEKTKVKGKGKKMKGSPNK